MKLYLISQTKENGYDTWDSALVAAKSPQRAVKIHPNRNTLWKKGKWSNVTDDHYFHSGSWPKDIKYVDAEYLGKAKRGTKEGVIVASFNAG